MERTEADVFTDGLGVMAKSLGGEGLIRELCKGFMMLMDEKKGVITIESLRRKCHLLGLGYMDDHQLRLMVSEGDIDGDGALSQMEFCVLMFRLSPHLMQASHFWLESALQME